MPRDDVDRILERLRQTRAGRESAAFVSSLRPSPAGRMVTSGFAPGDRVFDTVSGEEGEVIGGARENVVIPTAR